MLRCSTENEPGDSNFEKLILTSEGEKYSVLREGILSRKEIDIRILAKKVSKESVKERKCYCSKKG